MPPSDGPSVPVRFGPKGADVQGCLLRAAGGRLVVQSPVRFAVHTTLHLELETGEGNVRARGVVERLAPLGPWLAARGSATGGPVALTVLVFSDCPVLEAWLRRQSARDERRSHPRFDEPLRASLGTPSALGVSRALDVGRGGAFLEHAAPPAIGEPLAFRLHLPDGPPLRVQSRVVHVVDPARAAALGFAPGAGVAFDDLGPAEIARLEAYLARLSELEG